MTEEYIELMQDTVMFHVATINYSDQSKLQPP